MIRNNIISIIKIAGIPKVNLRCFVLCLKQYNPKREPIEPPIVATAISVLSDILHSCFIARFLSIYIKIKPNKFIIVKNINMIFFINYLKPPFLFMYIIS
ncbi:hypothetical protein CNEO4_700001 [Clostridium neonatale]|nr:hypothetical protein CNEO4_700001 [Clostridium neonatale]